MDWHQIAKDFQTFIAAYVALVAAVIAYASAQKVSNRQLAPRSLMIVEGGIAQ